MGTLLGDTHLRSFRRWVFGAGVFTILASFPLAVPSLVGPYYSSLNSLNDLLRLGGTGLTTPAGAENMLFVNAAGVLFCIFGLLLIYAAMDLPHRLGIPLLNAIERVLYVVLLLYYAVVERLAGILVSFAVVDMVIAAVFFYYIARHRGVARRTW